MDADIRRERLRNALLSGLLLALLLLALWAGRWFPVVALSLEDIYFLPQPIDDRVIVVTMDNASFNRYGRSVAEWPRTLYADFIRQMSAAGARVVALDVLFFESTPDDEAVAAAIREARQSEAGTRVVLAAAASEPALPPASPQNALYFRSGSLPLPLLRDSGAYAGFVNTLPDADSRLRRQPSLLVIEGTTHYSFAITTFLAYLRVPAGAFAQLVTPADRALFLTPQHVLPVDASGMWRQNYFEDTRHLPSVSLHRAKPAHVRRRNPDERGGHAAGRQRPGGSAGAVAGGHHRPAHAVQQPAVCAAALVFEAAAGPAAAAGLVCGRHRVVFAAPRSAAHAVCGAGPGPAAAAGHRPGN
ncbi:MAG: CHASE2 domain-containing protein [Anaerolineae bacterium]|nr:CHASE2 domain-containing protein [Anaerolineae bacterium]